MTSEKPALPVDGQRDESEAGLGVEQEVTQEVTQEVARDGWDSKVEYFLAQLGFSVGLGNVWRFPYLCHQNGGGAFILLYVLLMGLVGVPLFFLELAAGQSIRQGSIGVWRHISPKFVGIGYSSCVVCFFVALYYNVIIGWSIFYLGSSFQYPLPWENCPTEGNGTVKECAASSPTVYFWYRKALDITDSIDETGEFNPIITGCLLAAWVIVCLAMYKGIKSTGKVMYFSSVFPYVVLLCFLIRGVTLDGASEGIKFMFYPRLEIWADVQVWRQAATQVFFALGLGFGSVIAYSSYNPRNNNCHRDAFTVSGVNFMTSLLATLVVFAVLGFRAKTIATECVKRNMKAVFEAMSSTHLPDLLINASDVESVSLNEYEHWYRTQGQQLSVPGYNITACSLEDELKQGVEGTGLAFIAFTEAMTLFPGSPFWSALFFLMLLNLGLSTMFGTMAGILTPLTDTFNTLRNHKLLFTACSCAVGFLLGLTFTQRCGNYFVTMFDDYSATLPLIIVVIFQTWSVAWVYGADRFLEDVRQMLDRPVPVVYKYLWKYVCPIAMLGLLGASLLKMILERPTYTAWNREKASKENLPYPDWALAVLSTLIIVAFLPVPIGFMHSLLLERLGQSPADAEVGYMPCATTDIDLTPLSTLPPSGDDPNPFPPLLHDNHDSRLPHGPIEHFESDL
ncbi:sodium-dependent neutral amino acid transporter B(0)AT2-like [Carassius auratus]|uniref:Transporter n=1 Tax=Carassius auratus TaxID=7957 RepID=A0A6P6NZG7_CARAU|nr:sodium-dependent neutral amino acid transporter B(0)AT2-like [Carassius auratus]XP_026114147.1 sodium-dependent neutral amino acid transporter B(0)AT2-like [Carassius auratus]XP_026114148.1 sodium-dependent neutral amino acid transporter B(0)AT2-like [Carassius auratus]XP_026114149.1 sodium-dependent neutral amino acid transporter B(0)AT2-like [Carassius auratus]XP_026114150.1 sodium-dependent neutral amino acid transporter B(0)AT2-like [Carassius auratus]